MAAAIASVHVASGGRAVLGIGRGDSSLAHLGLAPSSPSRLEQYVKVVRAYLRGEEVGFDELGPLAPPGSKQVDTLDLGDAPSSSHMPWMPKDLDPVPVEVAGTGPKVLDLAARLADRMLLAVGADPDRVTWGIDT